MSRIKQEGCARMSRVRTHKASSSPSASRAGLLVFVMVMLGPALLAPASAQGGNGGSTRSALAVTTIGGTVTDDQSGVPLPGITVQLLDTAGSVVDTNTTDAAGWYEFMVTPDTPYHLWWLASPDHYQEFYDNASNFGRSTSVSVSDGSTEIVNAGLTSNEHFGVVQSFLTDGVTGAPVVGVKVVLFRNGVPYLAKTSQDVLGMYGYVGVGWLDIYSEWTALYWDPAGVYQTMWWPQAPTRWTAQSNSIPYPEPVDLIASMWKKADLATISGTVTDAVSGLPLAGVDVRLFTNNKVFASTTTAADGTYAFADLIPGSQRVRFVDPSGTHSYRWWQNGNDFDSAVDVTVAANDNITGIDMALQPST